MADQEKDYRIQSQVYDPDVRMPNRAMMRAVGLTDETFKKPKIGAVLQVCCRIGSSEIVVVDNGGELGVLRHITSPQIHQCRKT